jgi:hypothetical protein
MSARLRTQNAEAVLAIVERCTLDETRQYGSMIPAAASFGRRLFAVNHAEVTCLRPLLARPAADSQGYRDSVGSLVAPRF